MRAARLMPVNWPKEGAACSAIQRLCPVTVRLTRSTASSCSAIVGVGIGQFKSRTFGIDPHIFSRFRNPEDRSLPVPPSLPVWRVAPSGQKSTRHKQAQICWRSSTDAARLSSTHQRILHQTPRMTIVLISDAPSRRRASRPVLPPPSTRPSADCSSLWRTCPASGAAACRGR